MINYAILLVTGLLSGILSSLFGLGGGLTIVPMLIIVLPFFNVTNSVIMHIAIGTSLAIMLINSLNSARSHHLSGNIQWHYFFNIIPYIIIGTILGTVIAYFLASSVLIFIFIIFLLVIIIRFIKILKIKNQPSHSRKKHSTLVERVSYGLLTGIISSCVGGGSSLIMVPFFKKLGLKIKQDAALAGTFNIFIALIATISYSFLGNSVAKLPKYSTGFIFWPAFAFILIGSFGGVPIGTRLANHLPEKLSTILYLLLLIIIFTTMVIKYLKMIS